MGGNDGRGVPMTWLGKAAKLVLPYGAVVVSRGLDCL